MLNSLIKMPILHTISISHVRHCEIQCRKMDGVQNEFATAMLHRMKFWIVSM